MAPPAKRVRTQLLTGDERPTELPRSHFRHGRERPEGRARERLPAAAGHGRRDAPRRRGRQLPEAARRALRRVRQFGVTATPWRGDKYDITRRFGEPSFQHGIAEGMARAVSPRSTTGSTSTTSTGMSSRAASEQRATRSRSSTRRSSCRSATRRSSSASPTPTTPRRAPRHRLLPDDRARRAVRRTLLRRVNPAWRDARCLHSELNRQERQRRWSDFRLGRIPIITVRDIFNEGVDVPDVNIICFLRVTHSRRIFVQQLGRGLRLAPRQERVTVARLRHRHPARRRRARYQTGDGAPRDRDRHGPGAGDDQLQRRRASAASWTPGSRTPPTSRPARTRSGCSSPRSIGACNEPAPAELREAGIRRLYADAERIDWENLSCPERPTQYAKWLEDKEVGGELLSSNPPSQGCESG